MINDWGRTSVEIADHRCGRVDAEVVIDRRQEVAGATDAFDGIFAALVGAADELALGDASAPAGTMQPGRDHWPRAFSNIWAGGGIQHGRYIGGTDKRGEDSIERICGPGDFLATIYHHMGIDSANTLIRDFNGRPTPIVDHGKPIPELMG